MNTLFLSGCSLHITLYCIFLKLVLQGYPEFLGTYACHTYFEWYTTAACQSLPTPTAEAMCYVYDAHGYMRDLNPLIKSSSSHRVVTGDDSEMFINVCRDIPQGVYFSSSMIDHILHDFDCNLLSFLSVIVIIQWLW